MSNAPSTPITWRARTDSREHEAVARAAQRMTELCGPADTALILRRVTALLEGRESAMTIAVRLNGPARATPAPLDVVPFAGNLEHRPRRAANDADLAAELRVQREIDRVNRKPKRDPLPPPPKVEPKPRPVKRPPTPQRHGDGRHAPRIGKVVGNVVDAVSGKVTRQDILCPCGNTWQREYRSGRIPGKCESCR